ncbi:benzoate/H(+) symporter BenE family transporter [Paraglaciecola polaris]|uniref:Benzoate membrane transport protein n=1 Tax=Paraglaciecola polaris LMG 21857 TaxID=1129793 RepID=K6ZGY0_9ALTE|nr:benzoate/H(+) symporter BenE family transporter [Paraglaciecola polaris]GAC35266.1 benzoate membrane transport protein [Paraglaciecola polaris LMG 21857]|tara:strand:+ start:6412 stop:7617 length:1206 start_codon:yes stop_codon:yes gene_type:complete
MRNLFKDMSLSAVSAGFIAVLVGFASAVAIVFQAAQAAGATHEMIVSWVWALGVGMGLGCFGLSWYYKRPIIIVWSTPGAALLATSLAGVSVEQAIGIFIFVAVLTLITGMTGWFDRLTKRIPLPLASAMLAGILLQFGLGIFSSLALQPELVGIMLLSYFTAKRLLPRFSILLVLATGTLYALYAGMFNSTDIDLTMATPVWVSPQFDFSVLLGVGIPLFIVTMTAQNLPGMAVLKSSGYGQQPISPIITTSGALNLILAPFGGFSFNLAAITAAICTSEESHIDPAKRYVAGLSAGIFNVLAGLGATAVVSLFAAFPAALVATLAGLALLGTIGASLYSSVHDTQYRDAAVLTFLVTASGVSLFDVSSAFWGLILGMLTLLFNRKAALKSHISASNNRA